MNGDGFQDLVFDTGTSFELHLGSQNWLDGPVWSLARDRNAPDRRIAVMPDVDGDGFDDLLVHGAPGPLELYRGDAGGLARAPALRIDAPVDAHHFGQLVACGDFDGDGATDLVVSAHGAWKVYAYRGPDLIDRAAPTRTIDVEVGKDVIVGLHAADFNGDGFDDLAIVTPDLPDLEVPRILEHAGSPDFFDNAPSRDD